ncbi:hypothetical protein [Formosa algae]|uniref:Lipoprotein n=1 Tax=Formosa algae TaxID=225843 RepID=A0A9X1CB82_9FLAO|nr:hypothetical protein [Formosa algae]MBP1838864.1 hypothetical protein [Formosa algae]MDQ0333641.1 hypothetical protein [Formosa algae]OEI78831.1 hypothetical protein AST99_16775 [Formosa algae]
MKKPFAIIIILVIFSCKNDTPLCDEHSSPYYSSIIGIDFKEKRHNTRILGENITIRKAFKELTIKEKNIEPNNGFITLRIHLDKYGNFCNQETFEVDSDYQPTEFNNGTLIKKIRKISKSLSNWTNDTETKTFYLIRIKIKNGQIEEIF